MVGAEPGDMPMDVKTIAVIGAGPVGRRVAYLALRGGYETVLEDVSGARLDQARTWIRQQLASANTVELADAREDDFEIARLLIAHTVQDAIREADLIVEAVPDDEEMKIELFTVLDKFAKPNAILASAGAMSITELAEMTFCVDRCVGIRLVELGVDTKVMVLTRGLQTSDETVAACSKVAGRMGLDVDVVAYREVGVSSS
jgi:3-hydroxybutyryl-CoA dehydrogenase